jgi:hypothetical protein
MLAKSGLIFWVGHKGKSPSKKMGGPNSNALEKVWVFGRTKMPKVARDSARTSRKIQ